MANLGANLRRVRREMGLSQFGMADKLGIHPSRYGKIERGQVPGIRLGTAERYADRFGLSMHDPLCAPTVRASPDLTDCPGNAGSPAHHGGRVERGR